MLNDMNSCRNKPQLCCHTINFPSIRLAWIWKQQVPLCNLKELAPVYGWKYKLAAARFW